MIKPSRQPAITLEIIRSWPLPDLLAMIRVTEQVLATTRYGIRAVVDGRIVTTMTRANLRKSLIRTYRVQNEQLPIASVNDQRDGLGDPRKFPADDLERLYSLKLSHTLVGPLVHGCPP